MATPPYKSMYEAVSDEMCGLLMNLYFFSHRIDRLQAGQIQLMSPEESAEEVAFIEAMEREIIMGLCRLDDDESGTYSIRKYRKELVAKPTSEARSKAINKALEDFRTAIGPAKTRCRNRYIAHLTLQHDGSFLSPDDLRPMVEKAVEAMDVLTDSHQSYILPGNGVADIDLRQRLQL